MWTSPLVSAVVFLAALAIGDLISIKTRGIVIGALAVTIIYIGGSILGIVPPDSVESLGFSKVLSAFGLMAIVTNLGTMIELRQFLREWRTVLICIGALLLVGLAFATVGTLLFGQEFALVAYPPIAGGSVSTMMISDAAIAAGKQLLSSYAWMIGLLQFFVGLPLTSIVLQRYCKKLMKTGLQSETVAEKPTEQSGRRFKLPAIPEKYNTSYMVLAKLLLVTQLAVWLSGVTKIPAAVLCLVMGVLFCELGFLDKGSMQKGGVMGFMSLALMASGASSFNTMTLEGLKELIVPVVFFLLFGGVILALGGALMGKLLGYDMRLAAALGLSAMYGFPYSMMIPEQVISGLQPPEDLAKKMNDSIVPKMVIAGFTSVTVCSVIIASFVCPIVFP